MSPAQEEALERIQDIHLILQAHPQHSQELALLEELEMLTFFIKLGEVMFPILTPADLLVRGDVTPQTLIVRSLDNARCMVTVRRPPEPDTTHYFSLRPGR